MSSIQLLQTIFKDITGAQSFISQKLSGLEDLPAEAVKTYLARHAGLGTAINIIQLAADWITKNPGEPIPSSFINSSQNSAPSSDSSDSSSTDTAPVSVTVGTEAANG